MWPAVPIPGQWAYVLGACVLLLLAAGALFRGWRHDRAKGRPRCRKCAYPVVPGNARDVTEAVELAAQQRKQQQRKPKREAGKPTAPASRAGCLGNQPKPQHESEGSGGGWSCPECGWSPKYVKDLTRTRRSRKWLAVSVLLLVAACASWYTIHIQYRRLTLQESLPTAMTPTTWWIAMLPHRSGDEDLIVYYRAYPQAKIAGRGTLQLPLNGSGRMLTVNPLQSRGREAGWMAIPRWQAAWGASRCHTIMHDTSRAEDSRADAAWLYAELSELDEREEIEALTTIDCSEHDDLIVSVLDELYSCETAQDLIAEMAARVLANKTYTDSTRDWAGQVLAICGVESEPYLLALIHRDDPEPAPYLYWTLENLNVEYYEDTDAINASILRIYVALLQSPEPELISVILNSITTGSFRIWEQGELLHQMYIAIRPPLELLLIHDDEQIRKHAADLAGYLPEGMDFLFPPSDPRLIDAWAWLLSQPNEELQEIAANGLNHLTNRLTGTYRSDREPRARLRAVVESGLETVASDHARRRLEYALESLDDSDRLTARRDAEGVAARAERDAQAEDAAEPTPAEAE